MEFLQIFQLIFKVIDYLITFFCLLCTTFYILIAPLKLRDKKQKKRRNIFEEFVNEDSGFIWSITSKRKKSYKDKMDKYIQKKDLSEHVQLGQSRNN